MLLRNTQRRIKSDRLTTASPFTISSYLPPEDDGGAFKRYHGVYAHTWCCVRNFGIFVCVTFFSVYCYHMGAGRAWGFHCTLTNVSFSYRLTLLLHTC